MIAEAIAAAAHQLGAHRDGVLARLGGPIGERVRALAAPTKLARAEWRAVARAPLPPGFRGVHPTWIEAALAELPARARAALGSGGGEPVDVWLARWATARFVALPELRPGPLRHPDDAGAVEASVAIAWLESAGRAQLRLALDGVGEGSRRAAIARCDALRGNVVEIGASALAHDLSVVVRRQVVLRMPYTIGSGVARAFRIP